MSQDGRLIHAGFEAAIFVVKLGHLRHARGPEEIFDLVIGELTHQTGVEAPAFFADHRIAQAIVRGKALVQDGLALRGFGVGADLFPNRQVGPAIEIHFCRGVAGEGTASAEGGAHVLHQHHGFITGSSRRLGGGIYIFFVTDQALLGRFVVAVLHEGGKQFQAVPFISWASIGGIEFLPAPTLIVLAGFGHFVPGEFPDNGSRVEGFCADSARAALRIFRAVVALDADGEPRVGIVTQRPHQARGHDLGVDLVIVGAELHLYGFFLHVWCQGLNPVGVSTRVILQANFCVLPPICDPG